MCAIFGQVLTTGKPPRSEAQFEKLSLSLTHRGPDDSSICRMDKIILGFHRLSNVGLNNGMQPISTEGGVHLIGNGEIYNYKKLCNDISHLNYTFKTESDLEIILPLYIKYGMPRAIEMLDGMFAGLVWLFTSHRL